MAVHGASIAFEPDAVVSKRLLAQDEPQLRFQVWQVRQAWHYALAATGQTKVNV